MIKTKILFLAVSNRAYNFPIEVCFKKVSLVGLEF